MIYKTVTPCILVWMAAEVSKDEFPEAYQVVRNVHSELAIKIATSGTDQNVLLAKAKEKGLVQSVQASATVTPGPQSKKEKAEQLVTQVLEAVRADGTKIDVFLKLLEESLLHNIATYLRSKLQGYAHRHSDETGDFQPSHQACSGSGSKAANHPKLEPARVDDSAYVEASNSVHQDGDTGSSHQMAAADTTINASFKPLSAGVVIVEQDHTDNLVVETEDPMSAVTDTQPHAEGPPPMTSSSVPVLPEVKRMAQENKDLQAQLAQVQVEKDMIQKELVEKEEELKAVKEEKDSQIQALKTEMERLKVELKNEKENNVAEKAKYEKDIKRLKQEMKAKEDEYNKEKIRLMEDKHKLELRIEKMHTKEERMLRQISEEKVKVAELRIEMSEQKSERAVEDLKKQHEEEVAALKNEHRNSLEKTKELEEAIFKLRMRNPDTS